MPPKTASSSKTVAANGNSKVTTVATTNRAAAPAPTEPTKTITVQPQMLGIQCSGQEVSKVNTGSQAEKLKIEVGWQVLSIAGKKVANAKEITTALAAGKKSGKAYKVVFRLPQSGSGGNSDSSGGGSAASTKSGGGGNPAATTKGKSAADEAAEAAAAKAAEAAAAKAAEEAAAVKAAEEAAAAAEAERLRKLEAGNGEVTLLYNMYDEKFGIKEGKIRDVDIDDIYGLTDVMPGCKIKISKVKTDWKGETLKHPEMLDLSMIGNPYVPEDPEGTFCEMEKDTSYWVYVIEDAVQEAKDRAAVAAMLAVESAKAAAEKSEYAENGLPESCSCIEGNPCVDEYGCKDWTNRFAIAKRNGWKGF
jgi:hypothetical protein